MAAGAAPGGGFIRNVSNGSLSGADHDVDHRRPYNKNCQCALHKARGGGGSAVRCPRHSPLRPVHLVSYPMRRAWSEGNLALHAAAASCHSSSPSSSPSAMHASGRASLREPEDGSSVFFKV